jgi:hypothetical protein
LAYYQRREQSATQSRILIPLPPKYRLPEFTKFNGSERSSSIEHVSRYLSQLGMISVSDPLGVRFLSQSLTGPSFGSNTTRKLLKLGLPTWHRSDRSEGKLLKNISSASEWSKTDAIRPILQRRRWSNWHPWVWQSQSRIWAFNWSSILWHTWFRS